MNFFKTQNNTWIFSGFTDILIVGYDENNNANILNEAFLEIDFLDGSFYDSDGDEKKLLVKFENNTLSFETLSEDYDFWKDTENCTKQGCLGYVATLLNELKEDNDFEYDLTPKEHTEYEEVFLWHSDYVKEVHPELISSKTNKMKNI